jgi:hypothetical protein
MRTTGAEIAAAAGDAALDGFGRARPDRALSLLAPGAARVAIAHNAGGVVVGVESPGGNGRLLVASLEAAGHQVFNVLAWCMHRERHRQGLVRPIPATQSRSRRSCCANARSSGPRSSPELVRALALLELQRRRVVRDRTQAIQRLRADWNQVCPVGEARVANLTTASASCAGSSGSASARAWSSGSRPAASATSPATSKDLNQRTEALDTEIDKLLAEHGNRSKISTAPDHRSPPQ